MLTSLKNSHCKPTLTHRIDILHLVTHKQLIIVTTHYISETCVLQHCVEGGGLKRGVTGGG